MDFLFASQDASTASLTWTMTLLADHPEILQKVHAPHSAVWLQPLSGAPGRSRPASPQHRLHHPSKLLVLP